ncbi:MAG: SMP-30/gluconolactonase/LRE family protein [Chloroflexota bacterium]
MKRYVAACSLTALLAWATLAAPVAARSFPGTIELPGATSAEGIATGPGTTFFAGDLNTGDIFRGDLRAGTAALFRDVPAGRNALGMKVDLAHGLLFVAGGFTGQGYVYDLATGADVAVFQFAPAAPGGIINDVIVARGAAWFTDSVTPHLYRVPIHADGTVGTPSTLVVTGPAADTSGGFNLNGIAATPNGKTLVVAHSGTGKLYTVDPRTGASAEIVGANVPFVDGILFEAGRIWAVQNFANQVTELDPSPDLSSATVVRVIHDDDFQVPTTIARQGSRLAVVNSKFDDPVPPFQVVIVNR